MTALTDDVRELLTAIRDALDVPLPASLDDEPTHRRLMEHRIGVVCCSVRGLLAEADPNPRFDAAHIRKGITRYPVTYTAWSAAAAGKDTAGTAPQPESAPHTLAAVSDPGILGGTPCIPGTRVPADTVTALLAGRLTPDEVHRLYPTVSPGAAQRLANASDSCGRCHRPFDPADTRFDGHAQYRDTPWCRRCIDTCHEGSTDHRCVICTPDAYTTGGAR